MHKKLIVLVMLCSLGFAVTAGLAFAFAPDDSPRSSEASKLHRKDGDMFVYWGGTRSWRRSLRADSVGNRTFRGGGLHGGK